MSGKKEFRYVVRYSPYVKNYATVKKLSMRQFHRSAPAPRQDFLAGLSNQKNFLPLPKRGVKAPALAVGSMSIAYRRVADLGID